MGRATDRWRVRFACACAACRLMSHTVDADASRPLMRFRDPYFRPDYCDRRREHEDDEAPGDVDAG
jgi:hypothetical protein